MVAAVKTCLATGGVGFIGSNFLLAEWRRGDTRMVNLDLLTCAGNLMNLESFQDNRDPMFIQDTLVIVVWFAISWTSIARAQFSKN